MSKQPRSSAAIMIDQDLCKSGSVNINENKVDQCPAMRPDLPHARLINFAHHKLGHRQKKGIKQNVTDKR